MVRHRVLFMFLLMLVMKILG